MEGEITKGELCMAGIITLFHDYASKDGDKDHLSKSEVKQLLKKEFPNFTGEVNSKEVADQLMASLDINGDEKVDFQEFVCMISTFSILCKAALDKCCPK